MPSVRSTALLSAFVSLASFGAGVAATVWYLGRQPAVPDVDAFALAAEARDALEARDLERAENRARQIPEQDALYPDALLILGEVAARRERMDEALRLYDEVPRSGGETDAKARLAAGEILLRRGRLQAAYDDFHDALKLFPEAPFARNRLVLPLEYSGRRFEAAEEIFQLIQADAFAERHLVLISDPAPVQELPTEVRRSEPDPEDAMVNLGNGRMAFYRSEFDLAQRFFQQALQLEPGLVEAWVRLGDIHLQREDYVALHDWQRQGPEGAEWHPQLWWIRGQWAEATGEPAAACRCYWETLRRDPNTQVACYRLSRLLSSVRPEADAGAYLRRAVLLEEMSRVAQLLHNNEHHLPSMREAARLCEELGRHWEAAGWARATLVVAPHTEWAEQMLAACEPRLAEIPTRQDPERDPSALVNLSDLPLPTYRSRPESTPLANIDPAAGAIRFEDEAVRRGVDFTYFNSPDVATQSGRMYEFTGGGVGVMDYDRDGWCDLYWVQGCRWPHEAGQTEYLDRLHRNRRGTASDATSLARLAEDRFGQGVAIGDYDQDGWPDVYVLNMFQNRLWRNLGDGTFEDATDSAGLNAARWTTSAVVADLDGDALPDIVDVNYAQGDDVFDRICEEGGVYRSCSPLVFAGADDQAFLNLGEGSFREVSREAGFEIGDGRGLGLVAFRPTAAERQLNLFVSNDMTANFYFANQTPQRGGGLHMQEQALIAGLAFDINGTSQACMGIAAADADRNGLLDFCVTNFYSEANNLYLQTGDGLFSDEAVAAGLRDPSYHMLGFGTQFLDADWDGWPDLVVANGHVDDFTHIGTPYRMRPQFFKNRGAARFSEIPAERIGGYFERELLGRGLAKLDWNRDRREDFAVSHLETPAALVVNHTASPNHAVSLQLVGRDVERDAIGTMVRVKAGDSEWTHQLTAGEGYEASNERRLVIGVGDATAISELRVDWIDGQTSEFRDIPVDADYNLVQGGPLLALPRE